MIKDYLGLTFAFRKKLGRVCLVLIKLFLIFVLCLLNQQVSNIHLLINAICRYLSFSR
jgi:hypothetical protein